LVYAEYYIPEVTGWEFGGWCEGGGRGVLGEVYERLKGVEVFGKYREGLVEALNGSEKVQGALVRIRKDIKRNGGARLPERRVGGYMDFMNEGEVK